MRSYSSSMASHPFQGFARPPYRDAKPPCCYKKISRVQGNDHIGPSVVRSLQYELVIGVNQLRPQSVSNMYGLTHPAKRFDDIYIRLRIDGTAEMFRPGQNRFVFQHKRHRDERPQLPLQNHSQKLSRCTFLAANGRDQNRSVEH